MLLHGNPTSSYLWRWVLPALQGLGRCIVPDLIGMGDSGKLGADDPQRYTFARHREFVDALLEVLGVGGDVVLVVHDWGSALGFDWARRHPGQVAAIAYMEALVRPLDSWEGWPENARSIFQRLRSPAGKELILGRNVFVERILPASVLRPLTAEEMGEYRRPFAAAGDGRLPTLIWPRQIPIAGEPGDVHQACAAYAAWLASASGVPKLFINAEPGSILTGAVRDFCRTWPDQAEATVPGIHFIQEDSWLIRTALILQPTYSHAADRARPSLEVSPPAYAAPRAFARCRISGCRVLLSACGPLSGADHRSGAGRQLPRCLPADGPAALRARLGA